MGATHGSLSYKIFFVHGDLPPDYKELFLDMINNHAFQPLTPEGEAEESLGWVALDSPLTHELTYDLVFDNHFLNLSMREDKYVWPSQTLTAHVLQAEEAYMEEHGKKKLTKFEREDIKERVAIELKHQMIPRMATVDMSWDLDQKRIRFWSQSPRKCETFQGLFYDTFGLEIVPLSPHQIVVETGSDEETIYAFESSVPAHFTDGVPGIDF